MGRITACTPHNANNSYCWGKQLHIIMQWLVSCCVALNHVVANPQALAYTADAKIAAATRQGGLVCPTGRDRCLVNLTEAWIGLQVRWSDKVDGLFSTHTSDKFQHIIETQEAMSLSMSFRMCGYKRNNQTGSLKMDSYEKEEWGRVRGIQSQKNCRPRSRRYRVAVQRLYFTTT